MTINAQTVIDGIKCTTQLNWIMARANYADIPNIFKDRADDIILIHNISTGITKETNEIVLGFFNKCNNYGGDINNIETFLIERFNIDIEHIYDTSMELLEVELPLRQNAIIEQYLPNYCSRNDVLELGLIEKFNEFHEDLGHVPVYYGGDGDADVHNSMASEDVDLVLSDLPFGVKPIDWAKSRETELRTILYNEAVQAMQN